LKLLLDTHIWLWAIGEPQRLGRRVLRELTAPGSEVWLSPVSLWEALLLVRKGRIRVSTDLSQWLEASASKVREAVLTHQIVAAADQLQMHPDPADRFLAATAKVLGLTLVTADEQLLGLGDIATLANR
jgi:PIN domain nuclease of toxin-antitoxin system